MLVLKLHAAVRFLLPNDWITGSFPRRMLRLPFVDGRGARAFTLNQFLMIEEVWRAAGPNLAAVAMAGLREDRAGRSAWYRRGRMTQLLPLMIRVMLVATFQFGGPCKTVDIPRRSALQEQGSRGAGKRVPEESAHIHPIPKAAEQLRAVRMHS